MKNYNFLKIVAIIYKIIAFIILIAGAILLIGALNSNNPIITIVSIVAITLLIFIGLMFVSESIYIMINIASDIEKNNYFLEINLDNSQSNITFQTKYLENQEKIIAILTQQKIKEQFTINIDEL